MSYDDMISLDDILEYIELDDIKQWLKFANYDEIWELRDYLIDMVNEIKESMKIKKD